MHNNLLKNLLGAFKNNEMSLDEFLSNLELFDSGKSLTEHITLDYTRTDRCGFPEFIYGAGKTAEQLIAIVNDTYNRKESVLVTRLEEASYSEIKEHIPVKLKYDALAKVLYFINSGIRGKIHTSSKKVAILTAGTTDVPVALEAKYTVEACGYETNNYFDTGVAGIHRLLNKIDEIKQYDAIIVAAGMEGALPSVVAGLVSVPVIAVPTSIGYGASLGGLTAMFAMLNSCANGVVVVNIDNGFGAACAAVRILNSSGK